MSEPKEKSLEELRRMSYKELVKHFNLSDRKAQDLKSAIKLEYYDILTDNSLTVPEMAKQLELERLTVSSYRCALIKVGLTERRGPGPSPDKSTGRRVRETLDGNPLTMTEIRKKVDEFYVGTLNQKNIDSIGRWGQKLYFLKGQEDLACSKLDKMLAESSLKLLSKEESILSTLNKPMTYKDLSKKSGLPEYRISEITRKLERKEKLMKFRLCIGRGVGSGYRSSKIFGNLANELYFYKPGQEEDVTNLIIQNIPPREKISVHMRQALTLQLKRCLPKPVFERVYAYYTPLISKIIKGEVKPPIDKDKRTYDPKYEILKLLTTQNRGMSWGKIIETLVFKVNYNTLSVYLCNLTSSGILSRDKGIYKPTPLAFKFVKKYEDRGK